MKISLPLLMALSLTFAWQGLAFAESHEGKKAEASAEQTKTDSGDEKKKAEDEDCE